MVIEGVNHLSIHSYLELPSASPIQLKIPALLSTAKYLGRDRPVKAAPFRLDRIT